MDSAKAKVFNLGLPKSGTTTLCFALRKAGYKVADWRVKGVGYVGAAMYLAYYRGNNPINRMQEFDAFTQMDIVRDGHNCWPQMDWGLLSAIREHYPDAKFLLSYRDAEKLSDSMFRWSNLGRRRLKQNDIPGLPIGYGRQHRHRVRWIEGHYAFCRKVFENDPLFLEYDITDPDAPKKISAFLETDLPWWGRANTNTRQMADEAEPEVQLAPEAAE